ncbi:hypothetical protein [Tsuneonella mangrovi]|uniref:hypothetical protein n=1 Tax=Tsuneonella mangrovi TaxID=1982042 RepID=UPI000BA2AEE6|nr:hypothetical protein [Tsuneonella mangrovi]
MKTTTKALAKGTIATVAAGAMALASATPATARDRDGHHDGIGAGEVIAGALIIGGIAAIASSAGKSHNRDYRYNDYRYNQGYGYDRGYGDRSGHSRYGSRDAVQQCVYAAQRNASRYRGDARVTDIRKVKRNRDGYRIEGRIAVNTRNADWRRGWGNDYRGYDNRYRGWDSGKFRCDVRYGRVVNLDYRGIRGL